MDKGDRTVTPSLCLAASESREPCVCCLTLQEVRGPTSHTVNGGTGKGSFTPIFPGPSEFTGLGVESGEHSSARQQESHFTFSTRHGIAGQGGPGMRQRLPGAVGLHSKLAPGGTE